MNSNLIGSLFGGHTGQVFWSNPCSTEIILDLKPPPILPLTSSGLFQSRNIKKHVSPFMSVQRLSIIKGCTKICWNHCKIMANDVKWYEMMKHWKFLGFLGLIPMVLGNLAMSPHVTPCHRGRFHGRLNSSLPIAPRPCSAPRSWQPGDPVGSTCQVPGSAAAGSSWVLVLLRILTWFDCPLELQQMSSCWACASTRSRPGRTGCL